MMPAERDAPAFEPSAAVYKCERQDDTLIVMPLGHSLRFAPGQVESETTKLVETFGKVEAKNIVVDLASVSLLDSIVISSIITLAKTARIRGGQAFLCNVSDHAENTVSHLGLDKLLTLSPTREAALATLK